MGKTAIAEGLALAIVSRAGADGAPLPEFLYDKRVLQLDVGLLIAGGCGRGGEREGGWQASSQGRTRLRVPKARGQIAAAQGLERVRPPPQGAACWRRQAGMHDPCSSCGACGMHGRAGAKERGELENRVTKLIGEIKEAGNVILM